MNQDNYPRSDWYAHAAPNAAPAAGGGPVKRHRGARIAGICVCAALVLLAGIYTFIRPFELPVLHLGGKIADRSFSIDFPGEEKEPERLPEDYDRDYRDYFSKYYASQSTEHREASAVMRTETGTSFRIRTESAEGKAERTLQELYPECMQSIVTVRALSAGRPGYYMGSGIVLSEDGYILTNQHILAGTDKAYVILPDDTEVQALLVGEDISTDLCVLKIKAEGLHPAVFGDSGELTVGDSVFAIGNPMSMNLRGTLTSGIISGVARSVSSDNRPMTLLQTTTPINEGSSGGALFNMYGQVVGVTNMKIVNPYSEVQVEGLCFAIPSATVKTVTDQLFSTGSYVRPGIGITVGEMTAEAAERYALPAGLYISAVSPGSDAKTQGVQPGDILTHINGEPVRKTDDVMAIRDTLAVGDSMTLTLYRDGETLEITITLGDFNQLY